MTGAARTALRTLATTLPLAVVLGVVGGVAAASLGDATAGVVVRGVLVTLGVLLAARFVAQAAAERGQGPVLAAVLAGSLAAFALDPFSWAGRTGLAQLGTSNPPVILLGDGLLWTGAALVGATWGLAVAAGSGSRRTGAAGGSSAYR